MFAAYRLLHLGVVGVAVGSVILNSFGASYDFANTNFITMDESNTPPTIANPYPSTITVAGLAGQVITNLTVTLNGFTHTFPSDANVILVGPTGQMALLMSEVGGQTLQDPSVTNLTLTLDDNSLYPLPIFDGLHTGTFQPGALSTPLFFDFPFPAPAGNSNAVPALSVFRDTDPDGTWSLFIVNDNGGAAGSISRGWSMNISAGGVPLRISTVGTNIVFSWPVTSTQVYSLQSSLTLLNPNAWSNVPGNPAQVAGQNVLTNANVNVPNVARYYRLIAQ